MKAPGHLAIRQIALDAVVAEVAEMEITPAIISIAHSDIHLSAQIGDVSLRNAIRRIKSAATIS